MIVELIDKLVQYALNTELIEPEDKIYTVNRLLELFGLEEYEGPKAIQEEIETPEELTSTEKAESPEVASTSGYSESPEQIASFDEPILEEILAGMLGFAYEQGFIKENSITYRDLFDTRIMGCLTPPPSVLNRKFRNLYQESPQAATDYYYRFSQDTDYIRRYRIKKDLHWVTSTEYGELDITVNLSKPEKDPKAIAAAKNTKQNGYPKCLLCAENVGYAGRIDHPARQNHRIIPLMICGQDWGFQYSPYVYYNEHCIIFNREHIPMRIDQAAFRKLLDFVTQFPHYFLGSNADLPIVGGSILSHDHFQGGNYEFAMAKAPVERFITIIGYEEIQTGVLQWPMSVIRLRSKETDRLAQLGGKILTAWRNYTDVSVGIHAFTGEEPHNTITPIARMRDGAYELDLVLRNNLTTEEHPLGVFHPHAELHHIKKENIGLIEVMGLAILPARLKTEMSLLEEYILDGKDLRSNEQLIKHADWAESFLPSYPELNQENIGEVLQTEIGKVFLEVLTHAGVYKRNQKGQEAFDRFLRSV